MIYELPGHLSYSQMETWSTCGEKLYLQRIAKVPSLPSWSLIGGSVLHEVTEKSDLTLVETGVRLTPTPQELATQLDEYAERESEKCGYPVEEFKANGRASKQWPDKENRDWWAESLPVMVERWVTFMDNSPWTLWFTPDGTPAIELAMNITLGGEVIKLAIDRVFVAGDRLRVVDLKSGSRTPDSARQLGLYATAIEQVFGVRPDDGCYWMARSGVTTEAEPLDRYTTESLGREFAAFRRAQRAGVFIAKPSNLCGSCGVRPYCSIKGDPNLIETVDRSFEEAV